MLAPKFVISARWRRIAAAGSRPRMTDRAIAETPLEIDRIESSRADAGTIRLRLGGRWLDPAGAERGGAAGGPGRGAPAPLPGHPRAAGGPRLTRLERQLQLPAWAEPRHAGQAALWLGNAGDPGAAAARRRVGAVRRRCAAGPPDAGASGARDADASGARDAGVSGARRRRRTRCPRRRARARWPTCCSRRPSPRCTVSSSAAQPSWRGSAAPWPTRSPTSSRARRCRPRSRPPRSSCGLQLERLTGVVESDRTELATADVGARAGACRARATGSPKMPSLRDQLAPSSGRTRTALPPRSSRLREAVACRQRRPRRRRQRGGRPAGRAGAAGLRAGRHPGARQGRERRPRRGAAAARRGPGAGRGARRRPRFGLSPSGRVESFLAVSANPAAVRPRG